MYISEDRISHLAHKIIEKLWRDDLADVSDQARALQNVKDSIGSYFAIAEEIDQIVRKKLASYSQSKVPGSREWDILYQQFYKEEMAKKRY